MITFFFCQLVVATLKKEKEKDDKRKQKSKIDKGNFFFLMKHIDTSTLEAELE